jgi:uncharacterized protein HemX
MSKNVPLNKNGKSKPLFIKKYLTTFFVICTLFLIIMAGVIRTKQQTLIKSLAENITQTQANTVQLQNLEEQQNQYQDWWKNEHLKTKQNALYDILYKIKLANLYYILGNNRQTLQLLKSTASLLETISDQDKRGIDIKKRIDQSIQTVQVLSSINVSQTIVTLDAIDQKIQTLPVFNQYKMTSNDQQTKTAHPKTAKKTSLKKWWAPILEQLRQLVTIHRTADDEGIFFKENALLIKQMVSQKILQAQQALLQNNIRLYQHDIDVVLTWLNEYFAKNRKKTEMLVRQLKNMRAYQIEPPQAIHLLQLSHMVENWLESLQIHTPSSNTKTEKTVTQSYPKSPLTTLPNLSPSKSIVEVSL